MIYFSIIHAHILLIVAVNIHAETVEKGGRRRKEDSVHSF
jgi:hypothetical protein